MWSVHSSVSVCKCVIRMIYELKKKRINNSCLGTIHGFLLWNLCTSHHLSALHILFSVEEVIILWLSKSIFCL